MSLAHSRLGDKLFSTGSQGPTEGEFTQLNGLFWFISKTISLQLIHSCRNGTIIYDHGNSQLSNLKMHF